mgnify:CR=1 FL=1
MKKLSKKFPSPTGDENAPLKALIFDSYYDSYKGVIVYVRIKEGTVKPGDRIRMMATGAEFDVVEVGVMHPAGLVPNKGLAAGDVGYIAASIKIFKIRVSVIRLQLLKMRRQSRCRDIKRLILWCTAVSILPMVHSMKI